LFPSYLRLGAALTYVLSIVTIRAKLKQKMKKIFTIKEILLEVFLDHENS